MRTFLENHKIYLEYLAAISAIVFILFQIVDHNKSTDKSAKLETYKLIEQILTRSYPTIENFRDAPKFEDATALAIAKELDSFLSELNTCIEVGTCDREISREFLCHSPKISGPLSYSSGIAKATMVVDEWSKSIGMMPPAIQEVYKKNLYHLRVMQRLNQIFGNTGKWESYDLISEGCK